jgi:hypothetical protein
MKNRSAGNRVSAIIQSMKRLTALALGLLMAVTLSGCVAWGHGLDPVEPAGRKIFPSPTIESLQPTLTWETADPEEMPGARYHLVVYRLEGFPSHEVVVYARRDLTTTSHTLDQPLLPGTRYHWRIGVTYSNGKETRTEWNGYRGFYFIPIPFIWFIGFTSGSYSFDTPA